MAKLTALVALMAVTGAVLVAAPIASAQAPPPPPANHTIRVFGAFKIISCVFAVSAFVAGNAALIFKARRLGGIVKVAKRLWKARSNEKRAELIFAAFGTLSGATGVIATCAH